METTSEDVCATSSSPHHRRLARGWSFASARPDEQDLVYCVVLHVIENAKFASSLPYLIAAIAGVLLLVGLWTPLAGITIAIHGFWVYFSGSAHSLNAIIVAVLGATVAMIGPGMWSIDARLYGRKHLEDPRH